MDSEIKKTRFRKQGADRRNMACLGNTVLKNSGLLLTSSLITLFCVTRNPVSNSFPAYSVSRQV